MLTLSPSRIAYQGWHIEIAPYEEGSAQQGYCFECYAPEMADYMDDAQVYPDWEAAWAAAQSFVDREIAIAAFIELANDWLATGRITEEEYWSLTDFE
ncbi:MAG TPA: hypothetical protein V6D06_00925 [Trichocoleus sp.]